MNEAEFSEKDCPLQGRGSKHENHLSVKISRLMGTCVVITIYLFIRFCVIYIKLAK
jgi:hypothetical protein